MIICIITEGINKGDGYIWGTKRSLSWKNQVSNWLIANYSVFSYQSNLNENIDSINKKYYEIELANYLSIGFRKVASVFAAETIIIGYLVAYIKILNGKMNLKIE